MQKMLQTVHQGDQAPSPPTLWEHRRSIINYGHFPNPTPVSEHFNQTDHSIDDVLLILLELIRIRTVTLSERYTRLTSLTKL